MKVYKFTVIREAFEHHINRYYPKRNKLTPKQIKEFKKWAKKYLNKNTYLAKELKVGIINYFLVTQNLMDPKTETAVDNTEVMHCCFCSNTLSWFSSEKILWSIDYQRQVYICDSCQDNINDPKYLNNGNNHRRL